MKDVMIDIETLGLAPNSVILTIAAVRFDRYTGESAGGTHVRLSPDQADRGIDKESIRWWFTQPSKSITDVLSGSTTLPDALRVLSDFVKTDDIVWSQGTDFDFPILQDAFDACGMAAPWKYYNKRDTRTVYDICGFDTRSIEHDGIYHNALDDCRHQIKCVAAATQQTKAAGNVPADSGE